MIDFLVRKFVKDYENVENSDVRTAYGVLASIVGIVCNVLLFAIKILVGAGLHSISVMADAFNNLSDAASSVISFVGVKMANKPADKDHPFGHGRIEYIAAFIVAFLVIEVGFTFFKSSIEKIKNPEQISFQMFSVCILALSVLIKLWMAYYNRRLGKRIHSAVMKATATDALGDVITTLVTILSILVFRMTGRNIDGFVGIFVSVVVIIAGINIAKETLAPLIGEPADAKLYQEIVKMVESYDGIIGTHDLIIHNYGPSKSMASIHAEVPSDVDIEVSHEIIDRAEREVTKKLGVFLVIHMDPIATHDSRIIELKRMVENVVREKDPAVTIHDFRFVDGKKQINLIFDMVLPYHYKKEEEKEFLDDVIQRIRQIDEKYQCVVTMEKTFAMEEEN